MVADGKIKLKSGVAVEDITENGVVFDDGSELPADLIVSARPSRRLIALQPVVYVPQAASCGTFACA